MYIPNYLQLIEHSVDNNYRSWLYTGVDTLAVMTAADYFADAKLRGMRIGDKIILRQVDKVPPIAPPLPDPVTVLTVDFTTIIAMGHRFVTALNASPVVPSGTAAGVFT